MLEIQRIKELLYMVPRAPEDEIPKGILEHECNGFAKRTGLVIPPDLRDWLMISNGPCVGPGGFYGIQPHRHHLDIESYLEAYPIWKNYGWIPIAGDGCGNHYILTQRDEFRCDNPILFIDTSTSFESDCYIVASDISHFIVAVLEQELGKRGWPFDKQFQLNFDPQIINCIGAKLPWDFVQPSM